MCQILERICDEGVKVSEVGFKCFMRLYEKFVSKYPEQCKQTLERTWEHIKNFVKEHRNENYNLLTNLYNIPELILEEQLFSKEYYRMINPNYIEEEKKTPLSSVPETPVNNNTYVTVSDNKLSYMYIIDCSIHK